MFKAIHLTQENKQTRAELKSIDESALPPGEVRVQVEYSTLNFKDALAITGRGLIVKNWPMVPGSSWPTGRRRISDTGRRM